jgi:hypothetical protein
MSVISRDVEGLVATFTLDRYYLKHYMCKIQSQSGDTVDLLPDDPDMKGDGLSGVPIANGLPGVSVTVAPGGDAVLFYENGDPEKPRAKLLSGSLISLSFDNGQLPVARVGDAVTVVVGGVAGTGTIIGGAPKVKA